MTTKKGVKSPRARGAKTAVAADKGPSMNSTANRPSTSYSLPRELRERLSEKYPGRIKSKIVEMAVSRFLDDLEGEQETSAKLAEVAADLYSRRGVLDLRQEWIESSLKDLRSDVDYIAHTIETLFHVRRYPLRIEVPTGGEFHDMYSDAAGAYRRDKELLAPAVGQVEELEKAAAHQAFENRKAEAEAILRSMPFMEDERFQIGWAGLGVGLFDREFQDEDPLSLSYKGKEGFEVLSIDMARTDLMVLYSPTRPYFRLNTADNRQRLGACGAEEVAKIIPVIVADYLAFRQHKGAIPKNPFYREPGSDADEDGTGES